MSAGPLSLLRVLLIGLWTVFWTIVALLIHWSTRRHDLPLAIARRIWAPAILKITGTQLRVVGLDDLDLSHAHLFVANHTSQLDIPVLFAALPIPLRFLAKQELRRVPLIGSFMAAMGMVFIDRGQSEAARRSIDDVADSLAAGMSLMAFPEGTRSVDGTLGAFKTGAFVAAIKSGVSVVPIYIRGANAVLPARSLAFRSGQVEVWVGQPVECRDCTLEDRRDLADRVRSRMMELAAQRVASSRT